MSYDPPRKSSSGGVREELERWRWSDADKATETSPTSKRKPSEISLPRIPHGKFLISPGGRKYPENCPQTPAIATLDSNRNVLPTEVEASTSAEDTARGDSINCGSCSDPPCDQCRLLAWENWLSIISYNGRNRETGVGNVTPEDPQ